MNNTSFAKFEGEPRTRAGKINNREYTSSFFNHDHPALLSEIELCGFYFDLQKQTLVRRCNYEI